MPLLKLTRANQYRKFNEDIERHLGGRPTDFSIGQHIQLLIKRVDELEASAIEARSAETGNTDSARKGDSLSGAVAKPDAPIQP